jgi:hypothetical protein
MLVVAAVTWILLAGAVIVQMAGAVAFARRLSSSSIVPGTRGGAWPNVGVVISLRGADATLSQSLESLLGQEYPCYRVHVVVDSPDDPAWNLATAVITADASGRGTVTPLGKRTGTCSLKCAAILQALDELDDDCDVVAFADADTVPHATWLRELVEPLRDPAIGATYGNRWFWPQQRTAGSMIRALWNAAAVVPMYLCGMPWGGTFAISRNALRTARLAELWSRSLVEDAPTRDALRGHGFNLQFVPSLMMINRESCTLAECIPFIVRQLLWTRIYHPGWGVVLAHTLVSTGLQLVAAWLAARGVLRGDHVSAALAASGLVMYWGGNVAMLAIIEHGMCGVARRRGERCADVPLGAAWLLVPWIIATQAVHVLAVVRASISRSVTWRGIRYAIRSGFDIEMQPYRAADESMFPRGRQNAPV